jgi:hypothetical protein
MKIRNYKLQISPLLRRLDLPSARPYPQFFEDRELGSASWSANFALASA